MAGKAESLNHSPPCLCCWEKLLSPLPRGGGPTAKVPCQLGVMVNCLQQELGGLGPGTLRTRPRAQERAGLVNQAGLGSNLDLGTCGQVNSSTTCKCSEPKLVHLGNWAHSDLSDLPQGFTNVMEEMCLAGCLTVAAIHLGVFFLLYFSTCCLYKPVYCRKEC